MAHELLSKLGFTNTEIAVYLNILEQGKATPASISRQTGIKRTTVYAAAEELVQKGIIEEDTTGKTKYFTSLDPAGLKNYIAKQSRELSQKAKIVDELIPELELRPKSKNLSIPKVRFIEGEAIADFLYTQTPIWVRSMVDTKQTTWWGFQDHKFVEKKEYRDWIDWYWQNSQDTDLKLLTNDSRIEKQTRKKLQRTKRQTKFWRGEKFTASQWVIGEYVVNLVIDQKKHYVVQIRDRVLADNLRNLFRSLWRTI